VVQAAGVLSRLGELCDSFAPAHRYALLADSRVADLYGTQALESFEASGRPAELFTFPAGEWNKSREEWAQLSDGMLRRGFGRDCAVVALGGGVTGDLAGFVAATYMRGVPVVQVPTTLLAMFDSAIGGKTGVDTEVGKNLVGAFHHPALVVVDPTLLETLPRMQRAAGLAEGVKTAAILDRELFEWLEARAGDLLDGEPEATAQAVWRVIAHKAAVVEEDPREGGRRAILNFGHTIGHALELVGGYEILHGEAVAAGMRAEARLGENLGVTETGTHQRIACLLEACALDRPLEEERPARALWEAVARDKKARGGSVRCVLLETLGRVARSPEGDWTFQIPREEGEAWFSAALQPSSDS
jgi:3-dehydroquinate synthase